MFATQPKNGHVKHSFWTQSFAEKFVVGSILMFVAANLTAQTEQVKTRGESVSNATTNQSELLKPWTGPFGGVPPWDKVNPEDFVGAISTAIELAKSDIAKIAENPDPPSFENTMLAMEQAARTLTRVQAIFFVHESNLNIGPLPEIQKTVMPMLAKYEDNIVQNEQLFARISK